jgi:hypothetical protein
MSRASAAETPAEEAPEGGLPEGDYAAKPLVSCSEAAQPKGTEADGALINNPYIKRPVHICR